MCLVVQATSAKTRGINRRKAEHAEASPRFNSFRQEAQCIYNG